MLDTPASADAGRLRALRRTRHAGHGCPQVGSLALAEGADLTRALGHICQTPLLLWLLRADYRPIIGDSSPLSAEARESQLPDKSVPANSLANDLLFKHRSQRLRALSRLKAPVQTPVRRILRRSQFRQTPTPPLAVPRPEALTRFRTIFHHPYLIPPATS
jgi:hypothetical protein